MAFEDCNERLVIGFHSGGSAIDKVVKLLCRKYYANISFSIWAYRDSVGVKAREAKATGAPC